MDFINNLDTLKNKYYFNKTQILTATLLVILSLTIYYLLKQNQSLQINNTITQDAHYIRQSVAKEINNNLELTEQLSYKWRQEQANSYNHWLLAAGQLVSLRPSIQAIQWVDSNFIVRWVQPIKGNSQALYIDLSRESNISKDLERSRDKKITIASNIVKLNSGTEGFLSYSPIYDNNLFKGFMLGVYNIEAVLKEAIDNKDYNYYSISISEGNNIFYKINKKIPESDLLQSLEKTFQVKVLDHNWDIKIIPSRKLIDKMTTILPEFILLVGIIISILIYLLTYYLGMFRNRNSQLQLISGVVSAFSADTEFESGLKICITNICKTINWDIGHVYLVSNTEEDKLVHANIWYFKDPDKYKDFYNVTINKTFELGEGLPGRVLKHNSPVWIDNIVKDNNFPRARLLKNISIKSAFGIPIKNKDKTVIVLEFYNKKIIKKDKSFLQTLNILSNELSIVYAKKRKGDVLAKLAYRDNLTNLNSRKIFDNEMKRAIFYAERQKSRVALILVEISNFKNINNNLGYKTGDQIIKEIAKIIKNTVRKEDLVGRYKGNQYAILLTNIDSKDQVESIANIINFNIKQVVKTGEYNLELDISMGIKISTRHDNSNSMIKSADKAKRDSSKSGKLEIV